MNDVFNIIQGVSVPTLTAANVTITGSGSPNWLLQVVGNAIQLKYTGSGSGTGLGGSAVPEPSSVALVVFAVVGLLTRRGSRNQS